MWGSRRVWRTQVIPEAVAAVGSIKDVGYSSEIQASFFCKIQVRFFCKIHCKIYLLTYEGEGKAGVSLTHSSCKNVIPVSLPNREM